MPTPPPPGVDVPEEVLFEGRPALVPSLGVLGLAIVTLGIYLLVRWVQVLGLHYRITTSRVVVETGVLGKKLEQLDLYRITDYQVERPFSQRVLGTGNIVLITVDKTNPRVEVKSLKTDVVALYEAIRKATEVDRGRRGVRMVDYE